MLYSRRAVADLAFEYAILTRLSRTATGPQIGKIVDGDLEASTRLREHLHRNRSEGGISRRVEIIEDVPISLRDALERRRSRRDMGRRNVLTWAQLASLLGLALSKSEKSLNLRSYPAASGIYEIETCVVVRECEGLKSGLWHYEIDDGKLFLLDADRASLREIAQLAAWAIGSDKVPPALVLFYADLHLIDSVYSALGLSLSLKHIGVMTQNIYLASEGLGLAACALGTGSRDAENMAIQAPLQSRFICLGGVAIGGQEAAS